MFLVTPENEWKEIGRTKLRVRLPGGLERATVTPKVDVTLNGQLAEGHAPDSAAPPRKTFQDLAGQATLGIDLGRGPWSFGYQMAVQGAEEQRDALRFSQEGTRAPQVDLSSWATKIAAGPATLEWGGVSFGESRLLINSFSSRGGRLSLALGNVADGRGYGAERAVDRRLGQLLRAGEGKEPRVRRDGRRRDRPVGARDAPRGGDPGRRLAPPPVELQPGLGDRRRTEPRRGRPPLANLLEGRFRFEGGFARNEFEAPSDPLLNQGEVVVPLLPTWRSAWFGNASFDVLKGARLSENAQANLTLTLRHEHVDPQYRSVAATLQSDLEQSAVELTAGLGAVTAQLLYGVNEDNLEDIPSILKTKTQRAQAQAAFPLGSLFGGRLPGGGSRSSRTDRNGRTSSPRTIRPAAAFSRRTSPTRSATTTRRESSGRPGSTRCGWKLNYSAGQPAGGTGERRLPQRGQLVFLTLQSASILDPDRIRERAGRAGRDRSVNRTYTPGHVGPPPARLPRARRNGIPHRHGKRRGDERRPSWTVNVEAAWRFEPPRKGTHGLSGQILVRYCSSDSRTSDLVFGTETFRKAWVVSSGVSLSLF